MVSCVCSVCDVKKRKVVQVIKCHSGAVSACCIDTQAGLLLTACEAERTTHFWDVTHILSTLSLSIPAAPATSNQSAGPLEDIHVLTECKSPIDDFGPIPSSFSPSAIHQRHTISHQDMMQTATSMPVWRTHASNQFSLQCEERVRRDADAEVGDSVSAPLPFRAHSGRLSISALRTSLSRQELQRKRAQAHASWLRSNLDDLDAMEHQLRQVRRFSV
jgi:hypothetical protein